MAKKELRAELRVEVTRRGELTAGETSFPCMVQDMSDSGLLLICTRPLPLGQSLHFTCELFPDQPIECTIEIVHTSEAGVGAKITKIDGKGAKLLQLFLQEHYTDNMKRWV